MNTAVEGVVSVLTMLCAVAIIAVIVSKKANTANVIQAAASGFNNGLAVAVSPVTGATSRPVLAYPNNGFPDLGMGDYSFQ